MTVVKSTIKSQILDLINNNDNEDDKDKAIEYFADGLADIVKDAITSGTVTVNAGITVSTTGTAIAQTGVTTAIGTGSIK